MRMETLKAGVAGLALLMVSGNPAQSHVLTCNIHEVVKRTIARQFAESVQSFGTAGNSVAELLVSETGSWTQIITDKNKLSCIVAGGKQWQRDKSWPSVLPGEDS